MGGRRITAAEANERYLAFNLEPIDCYVDRNTERRARCQRCGTIRWIKLGDLGKAIVCRWCHGWETWLPWAAHARALAGSWREINTNPADSLAALERAGVIPVTEPGDEFHPIGFLCPRCGETGVTVPERIGSGERGYFGCPRCLQKRTRRVLDQAEATYGAAGMRLLGPCRGEYVPQDVECLTCGTHRKVSLAAVTDGSASLCWTCTHGIRPDEPHRLYLVHFRLLRAMKVGITHARHDRRLYDHELVGGVVIHTADVPDRATARLVERVIIDRYRPWATTGLTVAELPQGGWTETWREDAPPLDLPRVAAAVLRGSQAAPEG